MKKSTLVILLLGISLLAVSLIGCQSKNIKDVPTADISSVLDVLNDDTSGITWHNQTAIKLGSKITFTGTGVSVDKSNIYISKGGSYTLSGTLSNGSIIIDTSDPINLTFNNANITNLSGPAINIKNAAIAYITLTTNTNNYLVDGKSHTDADLTGALFSNAPLILQGNGSINVSAQYKHGIISNRSITINNGIYTISSIQDGIGAKDTFTLNGGSIHIGAAINGIVSTKDMSLNEGVISIDQSTNGILSGNDINIKGCTINISDSTNGINCAENIIIDNGNLNLSANAASLLSGKTTTINNGNIHLSTMGHAIYTDGSLIMNNGVLVALANNPEASSIECADLFSINGGTLIAAGSITSLPDETASTQHTALLDHITADHFLHIQKKERSILTFLPSQDYRYLIFSSPQLTSEGKYTVYSGGTTSGGTNFYGLYQAAEYKMGKEISSFSCNEMITNSQLVSKNAQSANTSDDFSKTHIIQQAVSSPSPTPYATSHSKPKTGH